MPLMDDLLNLSRVDSQVRGLQNRLDSAQHFLNTQQNKLDVLNERHAELQIRKKHLQAAIANHEVEIAGVDERIEKLRDELSTAETNKQYSALLTELNTFKENRSELEGGTLLEMERLEEVNEQLAELDAEIIDRTKLRDSARQQHKERVGEVGERLAELESEREIATTSVSREQLETFNQLAIQYDGEAVAQVTEIDRRRREYACGACNIHLPFESVSILLTGNKPMVLCNACGRILYLEEETRGALVKK